MNGFELEKSKFHNLKITRKIFSSLLNFLNEQYSKQIWLHRPRYPCLQMTHLITNIWPRTSASTQRVVLTFLNHLVRTFISVFCFLYLLALFKRIVVCSLLFKKKKEMDFAFLSTEMNGSSSSTLGKSIEDS